MRSNSAGSTSNEVRAMWTILGTIIGVSAVIVMIAVGANRVTPDPLLDQR
jgi:hypothetical protein